jgi:hypothetical protein
MTDYPRGVAAGVRKSAKARNRGKWSTERRIKLYADSIVARELKAVFSDIAGRGPVIIYYSSRCAPAAPRCWWGCGP